jgi:hypothetical protein
VITAIPLCSAAWIFQAVDLDPHFIQSSPNSLRTER